MNCPEVDELVLQLEDEGTRPIKLPSDAKMEITLDEGEVLEIGRRGIGLLMSSTDAVDRLYEALGSPDRATIKFTSADESDLDSDVIDALERRFSGVD